MKITIGILTTDNVKEELVEHFGEYADMFQDIFCRVDQNIEMVNFDVHKGEYPNEIEEVDAYLITGSSASAYDDESWIADLGAFVGKLHEVKKPLIGICFGHQLIAHYLGGETGHLEFLKRHY